MKESWEYNLSERKNVIDNAELLDEITVEHKKLSECPYNLDQSYQSTVSDSMIASSQNVYNNFFDALSNNYFDYIYDSGFLLLNFKPLPREFFGKKLVHLVTLENFRIIEDDDFWGDNKNNGGVYLQTSDSVVMPNDDLLKEGEIICRVIVDVSKLFKNKRKLFIDEESITETPEEYKKSFFMYGGIPRSAVKKVQIFKIKRKDLLTEEETGHVQESNTKQEEKKYYRRLQSVKDRLQ